MILIIFFVYLICVHVIAVIVDKNCKHIIEKQIHVYRAMYYHVNNITLIRLT